MRPLRVVAAFYLYFIVKLFERCTFSYQVTTWEDIAMNASFGLWAIVFLIAAAQGLFLSGVIFMRKSRANNLLASLMLSFSLCLIGYVIFWSGYYEVLPFGVGMLTGLTYCFGPLLYFYIQSSNREVVFDLRHFLPLIGFAIYYGVFMHSSSSLVHNTQAVIQCGHLAIYSYLIFKFTYAHRGFNNGALKLFLWRKKLSRAFAGYCLTFLTYYVLVWTGLLRIEYDYMISVAAAFFIYFIGYQGFLHQDVLTMYEKSKYDKSSLTTSASESILQALKRLMEEQKAYLDGSLKLGDLASELGLTPHQISQVINEAEGVNFADFVNQYRIADAKRLLEHTDHKIIHVAYETGFNTKATFNKAFKKFTGVAPSQYRKSLAATAVKG